MEYKELLNALGRKCDLSIFMVPGHYQIQVSILGSMSFQDESDASAPNKWGLNGRLTSIFTRCVNYPVQFSTNQHQTVVGEIRILDICKHKRLIHIIKYLGNAHQIYFH